MRKLFKNILSYGLRFGEVPKDLSFLHKRNQEVFEATPARTSIPATSGASSFFFKRKHFIFKASLAPEDSFRPRHLPPLCQRFSINLDDVHCKVDHPCIG